MASSYCMCRCSGESVERLLIHCPLMGVLWNFVFSGYYQEEWWIGCLAGGIN
jgi:hypothetical protein